MLKFLSPLSRCELLIGSCENDSREKRRHPCEAKSLSNCELPSLCGDVFLLPAGKSGSFNRKRVKFNPIVSVKLIHDQTQDNSADLYLFKADYKNIRDQIRSSIKQIECEGIKDEGHQLCARGLESRICSDKRARRMNILLAVHKILENQSILNPESLANLSTSSSLECLTLAYNSAQQDAKEASDYQGQSEEDGFVEILL